MGKKQNKTKQKKKKQDKSEWKKKNNHMDTQTVHLCHGS